MSMRKFLSFLFVLLLVVILASCDNTKKTTTDTTGSLKGSAPVISGAEDVTITKGSKFVPLEGVTAYDEEDGDLTDKIQYSGNVNPHVPGEYYAIYTVVDSDGNKVEVKRKVIVIEVDEEAPILSGVADVTIIVGEAFDVLEGVQAIDTIDGDLTESIIVTGEVNVWVPGTYTIKYEVSDSEGNRVEQTREVVVGFGDFVFEEENALQNGLFDSDEAWVLEGANGEVKDGVFEIIPQINGKLVQGNITGGAIDEQYADFVLLKVVFKAKANGNQTVKVRVSNAHTSDEPIELTNEWETYTAYLRLSKALSDGKIEFEFSTTSKVYFDEAALYFSEVKDTVAPVISGGDDPVYVPVGNREAIEYLVKRGVTANDNFDGNITSKITVNLEGIDIDTVGEKTVVLEVVDSSGNVGRKERTVYFCKAFDTGIIHDSSFDGELDESQWGLSGGGSDVSLYTENGHMVVDIVKPGDWPSATSPYLKGVTTDQLNVPGYYLFVFKVKADKNRLMQIRAGLDLMEAPWIEDFEGASSVSFQITTEWVTHYLVFYVHSKTSSKGYKDVKFEVNVGTITWGDEEKNNKVYFDDMQFYYLTMTDEAPTIERVPGLKTNFLVGSNMPDLTKYVTVFDREDGEILITQDHISTNLDMNTPGTYDVTYKVTDSSGNKVSYTITIKIVEEEDNTPPTISINDDLPTVFDQFDDVEVNLADYITIVDDVDGEIPVEEWMIDRGTFDLNVAGEHTVTYTVYDSFGNVATVTITFTVNDKEAPVINGAGYKKIRVGEPFDPFEGVTVRDNLDGVIELTEEHIIGNVDVNVTGIYTIIYRVTDRAGNVAEVERIIEVVSARNLVYDEENAKELLDLEREAEDQDGLATTTYENGVVKIHIVNAGEWDSYVMLKFYSDDLGLEFGKNYKIVIEVKAEKARRIGFKLGKSLESEPWFDIYDGLDENGNLFTVTDEFKIFEFEFTVDKEGDALLEILLGAIDYSEDENDNTIIFKSIRIVPEKIIEYDEENAIDLLDLEKEAENAETDYVDGQAVVTVENPGEWSSYAKFKFEGNELPLVVGKNYKLVIEVKVNATRRLGFKIGQGLDHEPWILPYEGIEADGNLFEVGTEFETFEFRFMVDQEGYPVLEVWFGFIDGSDNEYNSVITINTLKIVPEK